MKFIVDEMPFWESDCPFYEAGRCYEEGKCKLDKEDCDYMMAPAGRREPEDCRWLVAKEDAK